MDPMAVFMTDRCVIRDGRSGAGTLDRDTGAMTFPDRSIRYEGPCNVQERIASNTGPDGQSVVDEHEIRIPVGVEGIKAGMVVTVEGAETTDWVIERVAVRSMALTTRLVVKRRTGLPAVV